MEMRQEHRRGKGILSVKKKDTTVLLVFLLMHNNSHKLGDLTQIYYLRIFLDQESGHD